MRPFFLRFFLVLAALLWAGLGLTGCAKARDEARARQLVERFSQHFEADLCCTLDGLELRARISRPDPGSGTIEVMAPQSLAGLFYRMDAGYIEVSFCQLSFTLDQSAGGAPLPRALAALNTLLSPQPQALPVREGDVWRMSADVEGRRCSLLIAEDSGLPVKLLMEGGDWEIALENFVFLG